MKKMYVFLAAAVLFSGCTSHNAKHSDSLKDISTMKDTVTVKPAGSYEECFSLTKDQIMVYSFSSTNPVNFNIHYHGVDGIHYPVSETQVNQYDGVFDPQRRGLDLDEQDSFCLMWENQDMMQLSLSYECTVKGN